MNRGRPARSSLLIPTLFQPYPCHWLLGAALFRNCELQKLLLCEYKITLFTCFSTLLLLSDFQRFNRSDVSSLLRSSSGLQNMSKRVTTLSSALLLATAFPVTDRFFAPSPRRRENPSVAADNALLLMAMANRIDGCGVGYRECSTCVVTR